MLGWLLLAAGVWWAFRTNPAEQSFDLKRAGVDLGDTDDDNNSKSSKISFSKFLPSFLRSSPRRQIIPVKYTNCHLFGIIFVPQTNEYFLGCFCKWYFLYSPAGWVQTAGHRQRSGPPAALTSVVATSAEDVADKARSNAIQAKSRKNYQSAAEWFCKAAEALERTASSSSTGFAGFQSGSDYEEAAKMFRMADRMNDYEACLLKAVDLYERSGGRSAGTRVGRILETFSTYYIASQRTGEAIQALRRAIEAYQMEDDRRYLGLMASLGDLEASRGRYREANQLFAELMQSNEPAFSFRRSDFLLSRGVCLLAVACTAEGDSNCSAAMTELQTLLDDDQSSRQSQLVANLLRAFNGSDREFWTAMVEEYSKQSVSLDGWRLQTLRRLAEECLSELR